MVRVVFHSQGLLVLGCTSSTNYVDFVFFGVIGFILSVKLAVIEFVR